jgi:hypothetical protein
LLSKKSDCFQTGKAKRHDLPHWGHPVTDFSPEMLQHVGDAIVSKD